MFIIWKINLNFHIPRASNFEYSRIWNKHTPTFIIFGIFSRGYSLIIDLKRLKFYYISSHILMGYVYSFCQIFQKLHLFKGPRLFRTLEYQSLIVFYLKYTSVEYYQ